MSNKIHSMTGERLSFYKLFREKGYRVLIPIIQRDYAQGRQTTAEVRNQFLDALLGYIEENEPNRDLDFVYGSLNSTCLTTDFIPLDGQQRLTTLFLLHWYLYQISDNLEKKLEFKSNLFKDGKSMFSYETRTSSSEFCDALMAVDIDFVRNLPSSELVDKNNESGLAAAIKNQSWFFLSWQSDPTIQSMLTMLDAIHIKFADKKEYFERLIDLEKPIVTFLFLNLEEFKLTDDLYIKMNSRGKPLTSFENFKAKFEQHLEKVAIERFFFLPANGSEKEVSLKAYFAHNIDTKWANLFWAYRELVGNNDVYDEELKNFIRVILTNQYAVSNEKDANFEFLLGTQVAKRRKDYTDDISYYKYVELKAFSDAGILYLLDAFDNLVNGSEEIKTYLASEYRFYYDEQKVFENALKHSFTNAERVLFHAYVRFLIENKDDRSGLDQWMRVIHNLVNNTIIDGADEIARAIKSIEKLLSKETGILDYLRRNTPVDFFSSWQVLEEKIKAHLIGKNNYWRQEIERVEKHDAFDGQIGFILEFAGIIDYYEIHKNCNWTEQEDHDFYTLFKDYADKAIIVFENQGSYNSDFEWERAVLTKGDYLIGASSNRKNLLTTEKNTRDFSWKRLLRITEEHKTRRQYVKQVFDDELFDQLNLKQSLNQICDRKTNTWRDFLIDCPALIKYCSQGFIRYNSDNQIMLLGASQMNHWHAEIHTMYLWHKYLKPKQEDYKLFGEFRHVSVKSSEEQARIAFNNYCNNRIYYYGNIYYSNHGEDSKNPYIIEFYKEKGENVPEKYGNEIKSILDKFGFEWNETVYQLKCNDGDDVIEKFNQLYGELEKL